MKRWLPLLAVGMTAARTVAQELGTKPDLVTPPATAQPVAGPSIWQFGPMIIALGIIFMLLKFVLPKAMARFNRSLTTPLNSPIVLEESAAFATGTLQVVTVRGQSLLLAITPQGVNCLAKLDSDSSPAKDEPAFFELLDQQADQPAPQKIVKPKPKAPAGRKVHPAAKAYTNCATPESVSETDPIQRLEQLQKIANS